MTIFTFLPEARLVALIRTQALIQGNIYLYDQLLDILQPLVHPAGAFTLDPYAPI